MARPLRIEYPGAWYHVMNRGAGRQPISKTPKHRSMFLDLLGELVARFWIEIHAFCLMFNHYHLLIRTPLAGLSRAMRHLDGVYTQRFNRSVGTDGPLFRGRYKAIVIGDPTYRLFVSRYIHTNPVDAGIVSRPEDYRLSSYRAFLGLAPTPDWLWTDETLRHFGQEGRREKYKQFVDAGIDDQTRAFYERARLKPVFGSEAFREEMASFSADGGAGNDIERPDFSLLVDKPSLSTVERVVCETFGLLPEELRLSSGRKPGRREARGAFVLLALEASGKSLHEVARAIGFRSYATASNAMVWIRRETESRPGLRKTLQEARDRLQKLAFQPVGLKYKT